MALSRDAAAVDFDRLTLVDAVTLLHSSTLTSSALVREAIRRARTVPELCAFVLLDTDRALEAAKRADEALLSPSARPTRALEGVPVLIKDNIDVEGVATTFGTPALRSFVPSVDAEVVRRLRAAGAIILGKSHLHELCFGITGYTSLASHAGLIGVRNAYNLAHVAGGSSSGNGAALGARVVLAAVGSDTGGSVRIPAAVNGVCALRPSMQRYPSEGVAPMARTRDTAGPMAQTMADVALLDRVVTGSNPHPPIALQGVRLGLIADFMRDLDPDTAAVMATALSRMRGAGVVVVELDEPGFFHLHRSIGLAINVVENSRDLTAYLAVHHPHLTLQAVAEQVACPDLRAFYASHVCPTLLPQPDGSFVDAVPVYDRAMAEGRPALQRLYEEVVEREGLSALMFPTLRRVALVAEAGVNSRANAADFLRHTGVGSSAGMPGISLPIALGPTSGLPVSLALDGLRGWDGQLLALGIALEQLFGRLEPPAWCVKRFMVDHSR